MSAQLDTIEQHRARLFAIAYRMLGSATQAEDIVQETFVRWYAEPRDDVRSEGAYLTTITTNLCLDYLKSASTQRESYIGPWLPEPISTEGDMEYVNQTDPATEPGEEKAPESISFAFLVLLESLTPLERAVYLLREVFDYSHAEIAGILGRSEQACRQVYHRAHAAVVARRPRFAPSKETHLRLLGEFLAACRKDDFAGLKQLLVSDVVAFSDGGGKAAAARHPVVGAERVAKMYAGLWRKAPPGGIVHIRDVNGWPALVICRGGAVEVVINIESDGTQIHRIYATLNPDKLSFLRANAAHALPSDREVETTNV